MSTSRPNQPTPLWPLAAVLASLWLTACESDRRPAGRSSEGARAESAIAEMEAKGTCFAGQIAVETLLNRGGFAGRGDGAGAMGSASGETNGAAGAAGRRGGGFSGGSGRGRGRGAGGGTGAPEGSARGGENEAAPRIVASNLPPVRLHLRLTNLGSAPLQVEVSDFDSELGNFVVQPEEIQLPPNQSVEAEPMTSRLGVTSDAIPVTISLHAGDRTEKQVLVLRPVKPEQPATAAPSAPST